MNATERFDHYLEHLSEGLGHSDRHAGLRGYCTGLMLPLSRKSVEPMAARVDPMHASARHQSLHHFVAKAQWSDTQMLRRVCALCGAPHKAHYLERGFILSDVDRCEPLQHGAALRTPNKVVSLTATAGTRASRPWVSMLLCSPVRCQPSSRTPAWRRVSSAGWS